MRMKRTVLSLLLALAAGAAARRRGPERPGADDEDQGHGRAGQPPGEARHRQLHRPADPRRHRPRSGQEGRRVVLRPLHPRRRRRHRRLDPRKPGRGRRAGRAGRGAGEEAGRRGPAARARLPADPDRPDQGARIQDRVHPARVLRLRRHRHARAPGPQRRDAADTPTGTARRSAFRRSGPRRPAPRGPCRLRAVLPVLPPPGARPRRRLPPRRQRGARSMLTDRSRHGDGVDQAFDPGRPGQGHGPLLSRRRPLSPRRPRALFRQGRLPLPPRGGRLLGAVEGVGDGEPASAAKPPSAESGTSRRGRSSSSRRASGWPASAG